MGILNTNQLHGDYKEGLLQTAGSPDFRRNEAKIQESNAKTDKYRTDVVLAQRTAASKAAQEKEYSDILMSVHNDKTLTNDRERLVAVRSIAGGKGLRVLHDATTKQLAEHDDAQAKQQEAATKKQEATQKALQPNMKSMADNPTPENIAMNINSMRYMGQEEAADNLEKLYEQYKDTPKEQLRELFRSRIDPEWLKIQQINTGGSMQLADQFGNTVREIPKTQTPDSVATANTAAEKMRQSDRHLQIKEEGLNKRNKERMTFKRDASSIKSGLLGTVAEQTFALSKIQTRVEAKDTVELLDLMEQKVIENPLSTASPYAPFVRIAASIWAAFDPHSEEDAPSLSIMQVRDLIVGATKNMNKENRMSDQDRAKVENALGVKGFGTNPKITIDALRRAKHHVMSGVRAINELEKQQRDERSRIDDEKFLSMSYEQRVEWLKKGGK